MLEWKTVQLMITNYIVINEKFISKMLEICWIRDHYLEISRKVFTGNA